MAEVTADLWPVAGGRPANARLVVLNGIYGLMVVPPCPYEGCGWLMPELYCQQHGNFGMTFVSAKIGSLNHVKAMLA